MTRLDKNEFPYDVGEDFKKEVLKKLAAIDWNRYPELDDDYLINRISKYCGLEPEKIILGNGSSRLIKTILEIYSEDYSKIIIPNPTFPLFEYCASIYNYDIIHWNLTQDFEYDYLGFPKSEENSIYIICSPNNPTGNIINHDFLVQEINNNPSNLYIVDEAYFEFGGFSFCNWIDHFDNLIVLRSMSKALGLAGIRLGYVITSPEVKRRIESKEIPFKINPFTSIAAVEMINRMENDLNFYKRIEEIVLARDELVEKMRKILGGCTSIIKNTYTNFILVIFKDENFHRNILNILSEEEVEVTDLSPQIKNAIRITIGTKEETDFLLYHLIRAVNSTALGKCICL